MRVYYYRALDEEPRMPFEANVLFQDEHLVVADKPHFLPVTPSGSYLQETLLVRLKNKLGMDGLVPIHRIDRETAGLVLFSVNPAERDAYQAFFRRHEVSKALRSHRAMARRHRLSAYPQKPHRRRRSLLQATRGEGEPNSETLIDVLET
jgi:tRNA pseudouridine32 synthase/23S rRNA pseudouridine746 synthase